MLSSISQKVRIQLALANYQWFWNERIGLFEVLENFLHQILKGAFVKKKFSRLLKSISFQRVPVPLLWNEVSPLFWKMVHIFRAASGVSCFLDALSEVDLKGVCLVRVTIPCLFLSLYVGTRQARGSMYLKMTDNVQGSSAFKSWLLNLRIARNICNPSIWEANIGG